MSYTQENVAELNVLLQFTPSTNLMGIKIHHTADPALVAAAQRLFDRGFITLADGGYLTALGIKASEHAHVLFTMLNAHNDELAVS
jgi:uncharacterized protein (TIGR02647 family)